jgi:hypothetical protein
MTDLYKLIVWLFIAEATTTPLWNLTEQFFLKNIMDCHGIIFLTWNVLECCGKKSSLFKTYIGVQG